MTETVTLPTLIHALRCEFGLEVTRRPTSLDPVSLLAVLRIASARVENRHRTRATSVRMATWAVGDCLDSVLRPAMSLGTLLVQLELATRRLTTIEVSARVA